MNNHVASTVIMLLIQIYILFNLIRIKVLVASNLCYRYTTHADNCTEGVVVTEHYVYREGINYIVRFTIAVPHLCALVDTAFQ